MPRARWRSAATPSTPRATTALTREQFGRPLCEFQGLQWKFAEMAIKLEAAQLLLYRAATNADRGLPSAYETAVAKVACNQAGFEVAHEAVQVMGAHRLQPRGAGGILHAALPRLDDRRRLDRDAQEPHRRARVRPPLRPAAAETAQARSELGRESTIRLFTSPWRGEVDARRRQAYAACVNSMRARQEGDLG